MKRIFIVAICLVFVSVSAYAKDLKPSSDGKVPGQPFEFLQQQIDEIKAHIPGYYQVDGGWFYAGLYSGDNDCRTAVCPNGMKPTGFGAEAVAWEGVYDENGQPTGILPLPGEEKHGVFLLTEATPTQSICAAEDGGNPITLYGMEVCWFNNYQKGPVVFSGLRIYLMCVGNMIPRYCSNN